MSTTTPDVAATNARTPTEKNRDRVAELEIELVDLQAAVESDPHKYATNLDAWHERRRKRDDRIVAVESELRERKEWGHIVDSAPDALRSYVGTARTVQRRHQKALKHYAYGDDSESRRSIHDARADIKEWWRVFTMLVRDLDQRDDHVRDVLARELDAWLCARNALALALLAERAHIDLPVPEVGRDADLPTWVRYGVTRTDKLAGDA